MDDLIQKGLPEQARAIRQAVFVEEQGFDREFDETDSVSFHVVLYRDGVPAATGRLYRDGENPELYHIGRVAVLKEFRHCHFGTKVLARLEQKARELHAQTVAVLAQLQAKEFYEKNGYAAVGRVCFDESCPHIKMEKQITQGAKKC